MCPCVLVKTIVHCIGTNNPLTVSQIISAPYSPRLCTWAVEARCLAARANYSRGSGGVGMHKRPYENPEADNGYAKRARRDARREGPDSATVRARGGSRNQPAHDMGRLAMELSSCAQPPPMHRTHKPCIPPPMRRRRRRRAWRRPEAGRLCWPVPSFNGPPAFRRRRRRRGEAPSSGP